MSRDARRPVLACCPEAVARTAVLTAINSTPKGAGPAARGSRGLRRALLPLALALLHCAGTIEEPSRGGDQPDQRSATDARPPEPPPPAPGDTDAGAGPDAGAAADAGAVLPPGDPGPADVRFEVRSDREVHPISPLIYGVNGAPDAEVNRFGVLRLGGNRLTAYNWENNASNAGADWQYQNDGLLSSSDVPGTAVAARVDEARRIGAAALVTIPIVDYVAADKAGGGDVRNTANYLSTRFKQNRARKGAPLAAAPDPNDGYVNQDEFVAWLKASQPGMRILFSLDNEPDLWALTHPEVHPAQVGYDELCTRTLAYARMVKDTWPGAEVLGFVSYGWAGFTTLQSAPDRTGKGDFTDYWLERMRSASAAEGRRLVDYLDLHWYPEAKGGGTRITGPESDAAVAAARVQAPRSLFDGAYVEASWIAQNLGQPIRLIPRMREKIAAHDPGMKLAFTEWNYGGGNHISGAVATADVLGIFGREGVALANFWPLNEPESFSYAAFRAFRNFDGARAAFGDTSIFAASSDPAAATIYASVDAANPARVVLVAINKSTTAKTAGITLAHGSAYSRLEVHRLTAAGAQVVAAADVPAAAANAFRYSMPAMSVSVLVPKP